MPTPALLAAQEAGFVVGGEPLAIDLADTLVLVTDPPTDLLAGEQFARFWHLHDWALPPRWRMPDRATTVRARGAIRHLLDATIDGHRPERAAITLVNQLAARATVGTELATGPEGWRLVERWHADDRRDLALAAAARSVQALLTGESEARLRRCANPACSMLFVATDARRKWCTDNRCGNRTRVARHHDRHRGHERP
jgi:predicted RNA-binding Zn ribbon-like protein